MPKPRRDVLIIRGAREHNLAIEELTIPKQSLVVFTGVSGSGKSSLAFDTIYAEGQRRYVESLSSYARQFLGQLEKPKYDHLRGLCPTVAIEQKTAASNPRSTVGTVTEIYDYLRVLWARVGEQRCPCCGGAVSGRSAGAITQELLALPEGQRAVILAPVVEHRKGTLEAELEELTRAGFVRVRVDGVVHAVGAVPPLAKLRKHTLEVVVDRLVISRDARPRFVEAVELALRTGGGRVRVEVEGDEPRVYSEARTCPRCKLALAELTPQRLSFNTPLGMCPECHGLGTRLEVDPALLVPDPGLSIDEGAVEPWRNAAANEGWTGRIVSALCKELGIPRDVPWRKLTKKQRDMLMFGAGEQRISVDWKGEHSKGSWAMRWEGLGPQVRRRWEATRSEAMREKYRRYLRELPCGDCGGTRLCAEARAVVLEGKRLPDVLGATIAEASRWFEELSLEGTRAEIAAEVLKEIRHRLAFLVDVGLGYVTLDRGTGSLSGGEAQRIRLAAQLGSELSGVMYVLDEPSIGLHPRDGERLLRSLLRGRAQAALGACAARGRRQFREHLKVPLLQLGLSGSPHGRGPRVARSGLGLTRRQVTVTLAGSTGHRPGGDHGLHHPPDTSRHAFASAVRTPRELPRRDPRLEYS